VKQWGVPGDIPLIGDFDGDGKTDVAVYRPAGGNWYINSGTGVTSVVQWGSPGDVPVASDFDGDGRTDLAVWRPSDGTWYIVPSSNPSAAYTKQWGLPGDLPFAGDWDGDGKADFIIWHPTDGNLYISLSSNGSTEVVGLGASLTFNEPLFNNPPLTPFIGLR
jgi:FG-GAP-like repeat